jgi:hypothetical protein
MFHYMNNFMEMLLGSWSQLQSLQLTGNVVGIMVTTTITTTHKVLAGVPIFWSHRHNVFSYPYSFVVEDLVCSYPYSFFVETVVWNEDLNFCVWKNIFRS